MDHHLILNPLLLFLLTFSSCAQITSLSTAQPAVVASSRITVVGVVYCDMCSSNKFSRHSYLLPGVDVNIKCKFKASSPKTSEQMSVSVNRTTGKYGVYKVEIPNVDGVDCVEGLAIESVCTASLIPAAGGSACNVPAVKTSTNQISVKSKQDSLCIYSLAALTYRPPKRNHTLCAQTSSSSSNSFLNNWPSSLPFPPDWSPTKQP